MNGFLVHARIQKYFAFLNFSNNFSIEGGWYRSRFSVLFEDQRSMYIWASPDSISMTIWLFLPVSSSIRVIIPNSFSHLSSSLTRESMDIGMRPWAILWSVTISSACIHLCPRRDPSSPLRMIEYSASNYFHSD